MKTLFVSVAGTPKGPYSIATIQSMLREQKLQLSDLYIEEGMPEWQPLTTRAEFVVTGASPAGSSAFTTSPSREVGAATTPPPLPAAAIAEPPRAVPLASAVVRADSRTEVMSDERKDRAEVEADDDRFRSHLSTACYALVLVLGFFPYVTSDYEGGRFLTIWHNVGGFEIRAVLVVMCAVVGASIRIPIISSSLKVFICIMCSAIGVIALLALPTEVAYYPYRYPREVITGTYTVLYVLLYVLFIAGGALAFPWRKTPA